MAVVSFRALVGAYQNSHSVERDGCPGSTLQIIFHLQRGTEVEGVSQMYTNVDKGGAGYAQCGHLGFTYTWISLFITL